MTTDGDVIDVSVVRESQGGWRFQLTGGSWCPPMVRNHLDAELTGVLPGESELEDLDGHMWACDAPYRKTVTEDGVVRIQAGWWSALMLLVWLRDRLREGRG